MYREKNIMYAEAGYILAGNERKGFQLEVIDEQEKFTEVLIDSIERNELRNVVYFNGDVPRALLNARDFESIKDALVKIRYNDETQAKILMNGSSDVSYNRMQRWFLWAEKTAHIIVGDSDNLDVVKEIKIKEISQYDKSSAVNEFTYNNIPMWLDKETRSGLLTRFNAEKAAGIESTTLWYGTQSFSLTVDKGIEMVNALELYASACYDKTSEHKATVIALETIEEVESYDYITGYPEKLNFNL